MTYFTHPSVDPVTGLNDRQELFCRYFVQLGGYGSAAKAYSMAYGKEICDASRKGLSNMGGDLLRKDIVMNRVTYYRQRLAETLEIEPARRIMWLKVAAERAFEENDTRALIASVAEINKMLGSYNLPRPLSIDKKLSELDTLHDKENALTDSYQKGDLSGDDYRNLMTTLSNSKAKELDYLVGELRNHIK